MTHVGESSVHVTSFASAYSFCNFPGDAAMYYGLYLFAIALVLMIGQLAFALYQVLALLLVVGGIAIAQRSSAAAQR